MTEGETRRVVLLHGLWLPRASMRWVAGKLREAGFQPTIFGYPTVTGGPEAAEPALSRLLRREPCHVVAHSLGGLIAVHTLQQHPELPVQRVVCLGTPLCGSSAAEGLSRMPLAAAALGRSTGLLRQGCGAWRGQAALGMVAGRSPMGLGQLFGRFDGEHDGTVAVAETRVDGLTDHVVVPASHSGLLFSAPAVRQAVAFLQQGRFER